jgi:hypothetical protein
LLCGSASKTSPLEREGEKKEFGRVREPLKRGVERNERRKTIRKVRYL